MGGVISDSTGLGCSCGGDILTAQEMQTTKITRQVLAFASNNMSILE